MNIKYPKYLKMGDKYNKLTVIGIDGNSMWKEDGEMQMPSRWRYWCQCFCGNTACVSKGNLTTGNVLSCGCKKEEAYTQRKQEPNKFKIEGEYIKILLNTGQYTIINKQLHSKIKDIRWFINNSGYVQGHTKQTPDSTRQTVRLHRLLVDAPIGTVVDHIDRNPLNNCIENLRICTQRENALNTKTRHDGSGIKGVSFKKNMNQWSAYISYQGKKYFIGYYNTREEAGEARLKFEDSLDNGFIYNEFRGGLDEINSNG